ncbi:TPA: hypothetical protein SIA35_004238 [Aeromonas sobria]|nr:hypothetical protein [Aeromonas sobria]
MGINTAAAHGLKLEDNALKLAVSASNPGVEVAADGVKVKANTAAGIKVDTNGVGVMANAAKGMVVEADGVGINTAAAHGLKLEDNALKLAVSASNPGLEVVADGVKVKAHTAAGIKVDANGVGLNAGNGIACVNNQVNIKLAKGTYANGGGVQGSDHAISGSNGGLRLSAEGLSVDAGNGIEINGAGVSVKCYPNWGLGVNESGLWVVPNTGAGVKVDSFGVGVVANAAKGMLVDSNGVGINTAAPYGLKLEANALKLAVSASNPGVEVVADGIRVKANAAAGVRVDGAGVGVVTNNAKGISVDSQGIAVNVGKGLIASHNNINIKLAKGDYTNGTDSAGSNGTISGASGGLVLSDNGLSVNPGNGICLDAVGVSIKCAANSALTASENGGLNLNVASNRGLSIENNQLGVKGYDTLYIKLLCDIHRARLYAVSDTVIALGANYVNGNQNNFVIYFYGRGGAIVSNHGYSALNISDRRPERMQLATAHGFSGAYGQILSAIWVGFHPNSGALIDVPFIFNDLGQRGSSRMSFASAQ